MHALDAQLRAVGQGVDLTARIVVIELSVYRIALSLKKIAKRVAQSRLPSMPHVQRTGWVGRDKLHQQLLLGFGLGAKVVPGLQHLRDHRLFGAGLEPQIQKTGSCNFNVLHMLPIDL